MLADSLPIYLFPGIQAHYPIYNRLLPLVPGAVVMEFPEPFEHDTLRSYAERVAQQLPADCFVGGVSFGGIVALEVARVVKPRGCILIASISHPRQMPPWFSVWRPLGGRATSRLLGMTSATATIVPRRLRTRSTMRLSMLKGNDAKWHRWATASVLDWRPDSTSLPCPVVHIHGDADTTFPIRYVDADIVIAGGRHNLPVSHPAETARAIVEFARSVT